MKVSKKCLFQIDLALNEAVSDTMERYIPEICERVPEDWTPEEKLAFDVITETQDALSKKLKELFTT